MSLKKISLFIVAVIALTGCSRTSARNFFLGEAGGPDAFVIGSTLDPLDRNFTSNSELPKPVAVKPLNLQPSRAIKAGDILGIVKHDIKINGVSQDVEVLGIKLKTDKSAVDFVKFDQEMQELYAEQSDRGFILDKVLGSKQSVDPTIEEKLQDE